MCGGVGKNGGKVQVTHSVSVLLTDRDESPRPKYLKVESSFLCMVKWGRGYNSSFSYQSYKLLGFLKLYI